MSSVSIILLNWNTLSYLKECIKSVKEFTPDAEIIIIDNGSTEKGTKEYIEEVADKYIFNNKNLGFSHGNNQGAELAFGDYLVFMNSDIVVGKYWLSEMLKTFSKHKNCGAVGTLSNPIAGFVNKTLVNFQQYKGQYSIDTQVSNLMGFCLLMKREVFNQIKFNESFELGCYEDNLLCYELTKKNYTLWISVKADVTHANPGSSFEANNLDYWAILEKNKEIYDKCVNL